MSGIFPDAPICYLMRPFLTSSRPHRHLLKTLLFEDSQKNAGLPSHHHRRCVGLRLALDNFPSLQDQPLRPRNNSKLGNILGPPGTHNIGGYVGRDGSVIDGDRLSIAACLLQTNINFSSRILTSHIHESLDLV